MAEVGWGLEIRGMECGHQSLEEQRIAKLEFNPPWTHPIRGLSVCRYEGDECVQV